MKTILYNPIFINPQAYYVFPRLTRYLQPDNESTAEPANYIGTIEVKVIAYGDTTLKRTYTNTDSIDLSEFKNTWIRISLFTKVGSCVLGEWKIGNMESDLPYIDPEVLASLKAVVIVGNKTNNDSDRAIVKNLVDASNPFVISNASYNLNSGYGKYNITFQHFPYRENIISINDNKVVFDKGGQLLLPYPSMDRDIPSFKVKVSGLSGTYHFRYYYRDSNGAQDSINMAKDGIYELPICYNVQSSSDGTNCGFANNGSDIVTIEQVPEFQGAFVTDGVNDTIISTKTAAEMGITDEVTVVSMIHQITLNTKYNIATTNYIENSDTKEHVRTDAYVAGKTGIYGYTASLINSTRSTIGYILGDIRDYQAVGTTNKQTILDSKFSVEGRVGGFGEVSSVAWYWTVIANKVLTADQINQVIAYYDLDRTLSPDIYCDVAKQGITNSNHTDFDDKLIDYSGNGRDIQLNNLAWDGDSGIGKYNYPNWKVTATIANTYSTIVNYPTVNGTYSINVNGVSELMQSIGLHLEIKYTTSTGIIYKDIKQDGVYSYILPDGATDLTLRFGGIPGIVNEPCNITITQIPSHAGALCLDGVNDFGKVTGMPVYKDYTVVTDREIFANIGAILSKNNPGAFVETAGNSVYSFGQATSGLKFISTRSISYLSKYSYCGQSIAAGAAEDVPDMWLGTIRDGDSRFFNGAIYSLMSFPYSMSEFLIERQLKKHKLGTLYPDMVEFRPIVKSNNKWDTIEIWQGDKTLYRPTVNDDKTGIYLKKDSTIGIYVKPYVGQKVSEIVYNGVSYTDLKLNSNGFYYKVVPITKSPQKITMTIEQDENYVLFNPVITSNVEYHKLDFYLNNYQKRINIGDYIPKGAYLRANFYLKNNVDELTAFIFNGVNIGYRRSSVDDTAFNISYIYNYDSPQEVNITIDEYIRYEDIVQPYPVIFQITDRNTNQRYSWGDKIKVGSSIRLSQGEKTNLLSGLYSIQSYEYEGETYSYNQLTDLNIILTKQSISLSCNKIWLLDNNEPKCILSPRLLRIPNSSYKILGYIPDISGHGNHGVIHNSAYAEGSGVNEDGSYQFDGVDDFVTIPTITGGKQVLMKVNWQSITGMAILYDQRTNGGFAIFNRDYDTNENKVPAYRARNIGGNTYIDGILNEYIYASQLQNITHNIVELYDPELNIGTLNPKIGSSYLNSNYAQMSLYDFMLFDNISTDDKIKELNEYVGIEAKVELPPYYWDAYGKTNLDADKATIQQRGVAIGDYDLINNNFAYEGMSGYNGYPAVFGTNKTYANLVPNDGNFILTSSHNIINVTKFDTSYGLLYSHIKLDGKLTSRNIDYPSYKIKVTGLGENFGLHYSYLESSSDTTVKGFEINNDGIYIIPKSFASDGSLTSNSDWIGFIFTGTAPESCNVTIEVLPEYENGLVYDGVTDYSENANIPALTDYTYIFKRDILGFNPRSVSMHKGTSTNAGRAFTSDYDYGETNEVLAYSFGSSIATPNATSKKIIYGTKTSVDGQPITPGSNIDDAGLFIGKWYDDFFKKMVFYKLILYPKTISLLQINFLKNLMERDEIIDLTNPIFIQE